jgi:hypothetical protein
VRAEGRADGGVEPAGELLGGLEGPLVAAVDQAGARGLEGDRRRRLVFHGTGGDQRRDLCAGILARGFVGPAGGLADVEKRERSLRLELARHLGEERRLLGAGDQQRLALLDRPLEVVELGPAELGIELDLPFCAGLSAGLGQRLRVERHGLFAVADEHAPAAPSERHICLPRAPVFRRARSQIRGGPARPALRSCSCAAF